MTYRTDGSAHDERIRVARAAVAERDRLEDERRSLVAQTAGVDRDVRVAELDRMLEALAGANDELAAARAAKRAAVAGSETPIGEELAAIASQMADSDVERALLDAAIAAGDHAQTGLWRYVALIREAKDLTDWAREGSWLTSRKLRAAYGMQQQMQADLEVFQRALADLGVAVDLAVAKVGEPRTRWEVFWGDREPKLTTAQVFEAACATLHRVETMILQTRLRRDRVAIRARELEQMAMQLVEPI